MSRIVIFAGAGASKGVAPEKYPTTLEYFEKLDKEIKGDDLFGELCASTRSILSTKVVDIEQVLWSIGEFLDFAHRTTDRNSIVYRLLGRSELAALSQNKFDRNHFDNAITLYRGRLNRLKDQIYLHVYKLYSVAPSKNELSNTWVPVIENFLRDDHRVDIFTTNYDLVFESTLKVIGGAFGDRVQTGISDGVYRELDQTIWNERNSGPSHVGLLTKLHGSVHWTWNDDGIRISDGGPKRNLSDHAIIYPGFKGVPAREPFIKFHDYLTRSLAAADVILVVGFAFRDEHIRKIFSSATASSSRVVIIDPNQIGGLPKFTSPPEFIKDYFGPEAVKKLAELI